MGLALTSCIVPAAGTPTFELGDDEVEIGIGIHGEPGRRREKLAPVDEIGRMARRRRSCRPRPRRATPSSPSSTAWAARRSSSSTCAFNSVDKILAGQGISIGRSLVGNYITSLEMAGFSVTLLRLDDELTALWDAPVHTAGPALGRLRRRPRPRPRPPRGSASARRSRS